MSSSFIPKVVRSARHDFIARQGERFMRGCATLNSRVPGLLFNRITQLLLDGACAGLAFYLAFQLRFDGAVPAKYRSIMLLWLAAVIVLRPFCIWILGAYASIWRYFNLRDMFSLSVAAALPSTLLLFARIVMARTFWFMAIPISIVLIDLGLFLLLVGTLRALRRAGFEYWRVTAAPRHRAVLLGTGDTLASGVRQVSLQSDIELVGLLSPDRHLHGRRIAGFPVVELRDDALPDVLVNYGVDIVFIAEAKLDCIDEIVQDTTQFGAEVRLLPSAANILRGDVRISAKLNPEHVLDGRNGSLDAPHTEVIKGFEGKDVLITGAGGSIGSEISRQVSRLSVNKAILLDRDENSIFELQNQLTELGSASQIVPLVGDIRDRQQLQHIFELHRPEVVLHAAAFKHVGIMEQNPCEAVLNNVMGTRYLAELAIEFEAKRFLMISTDKAVRPTSVMGATKRVAELLVRGMAMSNGHTTHIACVRFGNVVGSRGSVVPIFLRQIAAGGPVTITHEEMTRYFMTIPEAVQLVMQASTLPSNGTVYTLDLGDPLRITHLAHKLIEMSGLRPEKDIKIQYVGVRPGEKLHEQLWYEDCHVTPTAFARVLALEGQEAPSIEQELRELEQVAFARQDDSVLQMLRDMPIDFRVEHPSAMIA